MRLRGVPGGTRRAVATRRAWHPPPARAYPLSLIGPGSPGLVAASPLPGRAPPSSSGRAAVFADRRPDATGSCSPQGQAAGAQERVGQVVGVGDALEATP